MTIQIDTAGWNCLLGGVIVGAYRLETQQFAWGEIPVAHFQGEAFAQKAYLPAGAEIAARLLLHLEADRQENIQICSAYVLAGVRAWLRVEGHAWETARVGCPMHILVTTVFLQRLHARGLRRVDFDTLAAKQGLLFYECLKWLKGGNLNAARVLPDRARYAKTGWRTYALWANHPYPRAKEIVRQLKRGLKHEKR